jgi:hypothetical protein
MLMRPREFIAGIGGTAAWVFHARAEQPVPTVAFVTARSAAASERAVAAFRAGLGECFSSFCFTHPSTALPCDVGLGREPAID